MVAFAAFSIVVVDTIGLGYNFTFDADSRTSSISLLLRELVLNSIQFTFKN